MTDFAGVEPRCRPSPADLALRAEALRSERMERERTRLVEVQRYRREAQQSKSPRRERREEAASVPAVASVSPREELANRPDVTPSLSPLPAVDRSIEEMNELGRRDPKAWGVKVAEAGARRRCELTEPPPKPRTETEQLALAVLAAGKRRRLEPLTETERSALTAVAGADKNEEEALPPVVRALVLLNWKRRGGLDAQQAAWLGDYFGKVEATRELLG